jgi:hypothetical protein
MQMPERSPARLGEREGMSLEEEPSSCFSSKAAVGTRIRAGGSSKRVELPVVGDALESVGAAVLEAEAGTGGEVSHRA